MCANYPTMDVLTITEEMEIKKIFLPRKDLEHVSVSPDMVSIGLQALARYRQNNALFRCRDRLIMDIVEDRMKV